jgi:hypothetical protein
MMTEWFLRRARPLPGTFAAAPLAHHRASAIFVSADGDVRAPPDWQGAGHHAS